MPSQTNTDIPAPGAKVAHYFDDEFIHQVREGILEQLELVDNNNSDELFYAQELIYDKKDVEMLKSDDWFIRRFLKWEPTNLKDAVKAVHQSLVWRKRIQINTWSHSTFPAEFYQIAACFSYLPDKDGHNIIILRLRFNKKDPHGHQSLENLARHYFIHVLEQIVSNNPNRGFGIIFDCHKASLSNVDLDMARFIINTLSSHYSGAISYVCIYELPWIFNQIWKLVRSWLDEDAKKIVKFATLSNITEIIGHHHLPDYMGGTGSKNYRHVPKGVPSIEEVAQVIGINNRKDVIKLNEHFQKLIQLS